MSKVKTFCVKYNAKYYFYCCVLTILFAVPVGGFSELRKSFTIISDEIKPLATSNKFDANNNENQNDITTRIVSLDEINQSFLTKGNPVLTQFLLEHKSTHKIKLATYDRIKAHPLIIKAGFILATLLDPYTRKGVYITSISRSPKDQKRLLYRSRYRGWATKRSKHVLGGFAIDIAFVGRKVSMHKMMNLAKKFLARHLGKKAKLLRVVKEARCIHIELNSETAPNLIAQRVRELENLGILKEQKNKFIVPSLQAYIDEKIWQKRPKNKLLAFIP